MTVTLQSTNPCSPPQAFAVENLPVMIGRSPNAAVRLGDLTVSRRHCEIEEMDGVLVVRDLGSSNGTYVDSYRITEALLMPGQQLTTGAARFLVSYERGVATPRSCAEHEETCLRQET